MNNDPPQVFGDDLHDYPHDPGPAPDQDDEDFPAFRGWTGWGERVEPLAPDDEYPQPSFAGYEPASYEPVYPLRARPARPGYPQGPGYPLDASFGRNAAPVPAMEPLPGLEDQVAMSAPVLLPPRGTPDMVPPWPAMAPGPVPPEVLAPPPVPEPEYAGETSDSLTTESLLHGKRAAPGSGWRRTAYRITGGLLRFGESAAEMR